MRKLIIIHATPIVSTFLATLIATGIIERVFAGMFIISWIWAIVGVIKLTTLIK
jgi:hypothetical protein